MTDLTSFTIQSSLAYALYLSFSALSRRFVVYPATFRYSPPESILYARVGITTVVLPLLTMHMLYDVRCGTIV